MADSPVILVIDADAGDRTLSLTLLRRALPTATVVPVPDAATLADAIAARVPDGVVVAADIGWATVPDLIALARRRSPRGVVILFGRDADVVARALEPGIACDGVLLKSSTGFLALPSMVTEALARRERPPAAPGSAEEMQEIALVFSHDLREPVQQIERLARRVQTGDGAAATTAVERVLQSAERLRLMLDGMVEYLTVADRVVAPEPVDLNGCLQQASHHLRGVLDEAQAKVRADVLPTVAGDETQLVHVFQNLLSNAIKFRGHSPPVVTITAEPRGDQCLISFHDTGIGIPPEATERIFELGRRLHSRTEYPGTGIGLALCRRIVERHGGRIWAEAHEGPGSTFHVLLPARADAGLPAAMYERTEVP